MTSERTPITPQLLDAGIVAIFRGGRADRLEAAAEVLVTAGITCLELTLTTPGALEMLARLHNTCGPAVAVGMGSVTTEAEAEAAVAAGADFLVSPAVCADVVAVALRRGIACYPGGWTPTELLAGWRLGAAAVKLFPAASGGPEHLRAVLGPLPDIPLIPTGGVALDDIAAYLAAGAPAVGLGGPLLGDALAGGSLDGLRERAVGALAAVAASRRGDG